MHVSIPTRAPLPELTQRTRLTTRLIGVVWIVALIGHFTPAGEWPALWIYGLGALALTAWHGWRYNAWRAVGISWHNLRRALLWGGLLGGALMLLDLFNTYIYYRGGGEPMAQMEQLLVGQGLLALFPLLIIAEEWLWRGMLFSALRDRGMNGHLVVLITTLLHMLNHYAVAPVGLLERTMLAAMALPLGIAGGYMVLRTRNVWSSVTLHALTMVSMVLDIFVMPYIAHL